jgi:RHS repeat-associated protein
VLQERDANNLPTVTYTRGIDLAGGLQRAGGIGGLLARTDFQGTVFYHADAGGNITALIDGYQNLVGCYRYDPFGNPLGLSGSMADANLYRFSSKECHATSGLYYYGLRFYEPSLQRWLNRDPTEETSGFNLYLPFANDPEDRIDPHGDTSVLIPILLIGLTLVVQYESLIEWVWPTPEDTLRDWKPAPPTLQDQVREAIDQAFPMRWKPPPDPLLDWYERQANPNRYHDHSPAIEAPLPPDTVQQSWRCRQVREKDCPREKPRTPPRETWSNRGGPSTGGRRRTWKMNVPSNMWWRGVRPRGFSVRGPRLSGPSGWLRAVPGAWMNGNRPGFAGETPSEARLRPIPCTPQYTPPSSFPRLALRVLETGRERGRRI